MDYIRKIANSDILDNIIDLPENLRHKKVEIIILPYPEAEETGEIPRVSDSKGRLGRYHHQKSNHQEDSAWVEYAREYYENR